MRYPPIGFSPSGNYGRLRSDIFVVDEALNPCHNAIRDHVRVSGQDVVVFIQESGFDDGGRGGRVDLIKGMVLGHIGRDTVMVRQAGNPPISVTDARNQAVGQVGVTVGERRSNFESGGLIVNVLAGIIVDR